jgi:hypothetical protein
MARQLTLQSMFIPIDKGELEEHVERDFAILSKNLELEKAMEEEVVKWTVGRPKKQLEAVFQALTLTGFCLHFGDPFKLQ